MCQVVPAYFGHLDLDLCLVNAKFPGCASNLVSCNFQSWVSELDVGFGPQGISHEFARAGCSLTSLKAQTLYLYSRCADGTLNDMGITRLLRIRTVRCTVSFREWIGTVDD